MCIRDSNSGADANTDEQTADGEDRELPDTVTLLVTPEQSMILAELEADGDEMCIRDRLMA